MYARKAFQSPYRSSKDFRLKVRIIIQVVHIDLVQYCTQNEFLVYLDEWEQSVKARNGFKKGQKKKMLLSAETLLGLRITGIAPIHVVTLYIIA